MLTSISPRIEDPLCLRPLFQQHSIDQPPVGSLLEAAENPRAEFRPLFSGKARKNLQLIFVVRK